MKFYDLMTMALQNLSRRKMRTILTMIGVVAGTGMLVFMVSLGLGAQQSIQEMLEGMGDLTIIEIYNYGGGANQAGLDDKAMAQIQAMDGVLVATPFYNANADLLMVSGKQDRYQMNMYNVVGVYPQALQYLGYEYLEGSGFTENSPPYTVVFGQYAAYEFRDNKKKPGFNRVDPYPDANGKIKDPFVDVMHDKLIIRTNTNKEGAKQYEYKVTPAGILKEDWGKGYETSRGIFMDINDLKRMEADYNKANGLKKEEKKGYEQAKVKCTDIKMVGQVEEAIQAMGFNTYSQESQRKPLEDWVQQQQLFYGIIGGMTLFVAAVGIANTMYMSIYERTREIGVMKVVGCFVTDIRSEFLLEAGTIGFCGGIIGVLISYLFSFLSNYFGFSLGGMGGMMGGGGGSSMSIIPPWLALGGIVFATLVGLLSGFFPSNRAVRISALEAIKHD